MSVPTLEPVARQRPRRTRTRTVSARPALAVSTLPLQHLDLRPDFVSLVCPDCNTWCPVTGPQTRTPKLVAHHRETAGDGEAIRCNLGSNRRVDIDMTTAEWAKRLQDGVADTKSRRSNRVVRKPRTRTTPPITRILAPLLDAKGALQLYRNHRKRCAACKDTGHTRCIDGGRLAHLYAHKQRTESSRQQGLAACEALRQQGEESGPDRGLWLLREMQWAATAPAVRRTDAQRLRDELTAGLREYGPHLNRFERSALHRVITSLAENLRRL